MPEIVAAHLERVAKELAEQIEVREHEQKARWVIMERIKANAALLAAALAACAREELQALLDEHESVIEDDLGGWEVVRAEYIRKRIAALERAAGEKGAERA